MSPKRKRAARYGYHPQKKKAENPRKLPSFFLSFNRTFINKYDSAPPPPKQLYLEFPLEIVDGIFQKCAEIDDIVSATCLALTCKTFYPGLKRVFGWEDGLDDHGDMQYNMEKIDLESFLPNSMGGPAFLMYMFLKGEKPWMGPTYTEYDPTYKQFVTPRAFAKRGWSYL